jgi:hypothetical protein
MATIKLPLDQRNALVDLLVGVSALGARLLHQKKQPVPHPVPAKGLIDTGSAFTCISYQIQDSLGLIHPTGKQEIQTLPSPGSVTELDVFEVSVTLVHPKLPRGQLRVARSLPVLCGDVRAIGEDVIISLDLLQAARFIYNGMDGTFSLTIAKD